MHRDPPRGPPARLSRRRFAALAAAILLAAGFWRAAMALAMPCIARDSVSFCWYARDLGRLGLAHLRDPATQHHPLYPAAVLAAQRLARSAGAADAPMTWQRSGQAVSWLAGLAVVALSGAVASRLVRRLALPLDDRLATLGAMLLAALLPLNVWLSVEAMSDELHLAFYLAGVWALLRLNSPAAALCGAAAGLAFLTRPEGLVLVPAGLIALLTDRTASPVQRLGRGLLLSTAFLALAVPYWAAVGTLSPQKNPLDWFRAPAETVGHAQSWRPDAPSATPISRAGRMMPTPLLARLEKQDVPWYGLVPFVLYQLFRAGRVVVPLLALPPLLNLRRQWTRPPLVGLNVCLAGHLALTLLVLRQHKYLDVRHLLPAVGLLTPFAALLLARLAELARQPRLRATLAALILGLLLRAALAALILGLLLPLALYALRVPNAADGYLADAGRTLAARDPQIRQCVILAASRERRVPFYADARWLYWYDVPGDIAGPLARIRTERPDYFLLETGPGFERVGNDELLTALRADPALAPHLAWQAEWPAHAGGRLHAFQFNWP